MIKFLKSLYLNPRFYVYISVISGVFLLSFWMPGLYNIAWFMAIILVALFLVDALILFRNPKGIKAQRVLADKLSNSDENPIAVHITNNYRIRIVVSVIDELPVQFQKRDFQYNFALNAYEKFSFEYTVVPVERGEYHFGNLNVYVSSPLKIVAKRYGFDRNKTVAVYPSYIQMRKYEFLALNNRLTEYGLKKIRRIGHTMEFEQIKNYVLGDDVRTINWKATAKKGELMVNQYQDEKSQPIYSLIDTGRVMKMPFEQLKLLDYAINATLAFSNIAIKKNDKAGLITFSDQIEHILPANNKRTHINVINEALYNIDTRFLDADYGMLYATVKRWVKHRSMLLLYTNFEHLSAMKRQLPYLMGISRQHLLVTVFFENTELDTLISENAEDLQGIYHKAIAEKFAFEKRQIVKELENRGIHAILTKPGNLSVNVINKYLEFKSKGLI